MSSLPPSNKKYELTARDLILLSAFLGAAVGVGVFSIFKGKKPEVSEESKSPRDSSETTGTLASLGSPMERMVRHYSRNEEKEAKTDAFGDLSQTDQIKALKAETRRLNNLLMISEQLIAFSFFQELPLISFYLFF